jgi:hypothetical protein
MLQGDPDTLRKMKEKIRRIEEQTLELQSLGEGVPAVEKNARAILSSIYVLKFGISDVVDVQDESRVRE